jgi:serine phosphatase RsbU (regulator of sigma subunit)
MPLAIGPRVLGTLVATAPDPEGGVERLRAFAPVAAAAVANALEYERERRVARALTAGFIPELPRGVAGLEVGVLYEPAGKQASGGDVFGIWPLPGGALGLMVGDVSGSGLEVAATAAMVRFFAEARTFDTRAPAKVLEQTNAILRGRLPQGLFVPAFLAVIEGRTLRWSNAGHPAPQLLRAEGEGVAALGTTGIPLGVDEESRYEELEVELAPGDVLVAATDGLWEARRDHVQFGDARLTVLLAEVGRLLDPDALVRRLRDEAELWAGELHDDLVILAIRVQG